MVKPDLEDLIASLNSRYWVCEKCDESFPTKEETEKHEEKCMLHGTGKTNQTPRTKSIEWSKPHNLLFVLGVLLMILPLIPTFPCETPSSTDVVGSDWKEYGECVERKADWTSAASWLGSLGIVFCLIGLYNTIRERRN